MYNTRIAPSPTGDMHMGTARTAYFNWLIARSTGGEFIVRIDDTDLNRNDENKVTDIIKVIDWMGLDYNFLIRQSDRFDRYQEIAEALIKMETAIRLDDGAVLLQLNEGYRSAYNSYWTDKIVGNINIKNDDYDYVATMPIIKSNGSPTYNFASVIDDIDFEINYIVRGIDHQKNTSKQIQLYYLFIFLQSFRKDLFSQKILIPDYAHLGLLFKDKKKLSKRDGAASMIGYLESGVDPDAMLNFLLRLGWGPTKDDKSTSILSKEKTLELFLTQGKMRSSPANVDLIKLDSFDRKYKGRKRKKDGDLE